MISELDDEISSILKENLSRISVVIEKYCLDAIVDMVFTHINQYPCNYDELKSKIIASIKAKMKEAANNGA